MANRKKKTDEWNVWEDIDERTRARLLTVQMHQVVDVRNDLGEVRRTAVMAGPEKRGGEWVVWLRGIRGCYALCRVRPLPEPAEAIAWITSTEPHWHGTSSITMWTALMGRPPEGYTAGYGVPRDGADLWRCINLIREVPEWEARLAEVADFHPQWRPFVEGWRVLKLLFATADAHQAKPPKDIERRHAELILYTQIQECRAEGGDIGNGSYIANLQKEIAELANQIERKRRRENARTDRAAKQKPRSR